jgi:hypothetical protein
MSGRLRPDPGEAYPASLAVTYELRVVVPTRDRRANRAVSRSAATALLALVLCACGSDSAAEPDARSFPAPFVQATEWQPATITAPDHGPLRRGLADINAVGAALADYFRIGGPRELPDDAVTVTIPREIESSGTGVLVVEILNPGDGPVVGTQFRVRVERVDGRWIVDENAEIKFFCDQPVGDGVGPCE